MWKIYSDPAPRIASEPLNPEDVANRKTFQIGTLRRQLQTSSGFNGTIAGAVMRGVEPTEALDFANRIQAVQGPAATAALGRLVQPERVSIVIVGDSAKFVDQLRKLRPNVVVVPADKLDLTTASSVQ